MARDIDSPRVWTKVLGASLLGAAARYALDPAKGRRRRALARGRVGLRPLRLRGFWLRVRALGFG